MKMMQGVLLAAVVFVWGVAGAAEQDEIDRLPAPPDGYEVEYYAALARVHATYKLFDAAEKFQLKAIEMEKVPARKEMLSYELFDRIYCRAKWWDKAAREILRTISLVGPNNRAQMRKYHGDRARVLNEAGRTEEYIKELEIVAQMSDDEDEKTRSLRSLHLALQKLDRLEPKIEEYEAAVKKNPRDEITLRLLADIYYGGGLQALPGKAIEKYEQIREFLPDDVNACEHLARLYPVAGQPAKAVAMYEHLMKRNPKRFESYFLDAVNLLETGDKADAARTWCEKMGEQYPREPAVPIRIGNIYNVAREYAEAAEQYKKAIPLVEGHTDKIGLYFRLIDTQMAGRQYADAEQSCRQALKLDIRSEELRKRIRDSLNQALDLQGKPKE